jgi:hypothetical protein
MGKVIVGLHPRPPWRAAPLQYDGRYVPTAGRALIQT